MVTSIVSSLGGGSGLDTAKLVDDLANASRAPKANVLAKRVQAVQSKIGSVAQARSDLESFATVLARAQLYEDYLLGLSPSGLSCGDGPL